MNLSVEDLTVGGKIIFADGTQLDSSYSSLFSGFLNFERNPTLGTTTLLSDKLLITNEIETSSRLIAPSVRLQVVTFLSDLDENNLPVVQSRGFSDILRQKILDNGAMIDSIIPTILDPINKVGTFSNGDYTATLQPGSINLINNNDGLFMQQDNTQVLICGNPPFYYSQSKFDSFKLANDVDSQYATYTCNSATINTLGGPTLSYTAGDITIQDNGPTAIVQMTADGVTMTNNNLSATTNYLVNQINWQETSFQLLSNSNDRFLKFDTGMMHRVEELYVTIANKLEPWANYFIINGPGNGDIYTYPVEVYWCELLQSSGHPEGWTCYISNLDGSDVQLNSGDGKPFFAHNAGWQSGGLAIKKFSTVKLTLLFSASVGDYFWAVSQF